MHPVSFWTSLTEVGGFMLVISSIFSGLASMPWWLTMLPSRIPNGTPKMHLVGFSFQSVYFQGFENFGEVSDEGVSSLRLNHHVIDVGLDILPNLVLEAALDGSLISRTRILEPEGHGHVAVGAEWRDE
jgi:hypothetical protein